MLPKCMKTFPCRSHIPLQERCYIRSREKGRYLWAGSSSCFSPSTACTKAFPEARSQGCTPPTVRSQGPFKSIIILLVLHLARTPAPDTCVGRELIDLAGTGGSCQPLAQPFPTSEKALGPAGLCWRKRETAREVEDLLSGGGCLGEK